MPRLPANFRQLEAAIALLGTTISPYLIFWEAEGEREEHRSAGQFRLTQVDITLGFIVSNIISYFIIVTTATTLFAGHRTIQTAADAADALRPFAGDLATVVFALGLLGTGLLAIPMFAISIGFVVTELFNWPAGLSRSVQQAPAFYAVLAGSFLLGGAATFLGVDPVRAMLESQILAGILTPILIILILLLANDPRVIGDEKNPRYYNLWLAISFIVMTIGAIWLLRGLV